MRPELQRLHNELTAVRTEIAAVEDTARVATNGWTVAQVLAHIAKANRLSGESIEKTLALSPPLVGEETIRYSFLDRQVVKGMAGQGMKFPVPAIFEPGDAGPEAKQACLDSIDGLLSTIRNADSKRLAGLKVTSPVSTLLRLGLVAYLDGTVQHTRYHRHQI